MKLPQDNGIYCHAMYGPTFGTISFGPRFGSGYDLHIADQSNTNISNYLSFRNLFTHPDYAYYSNEDKIFLVGSYFQVSEIEVFTKQ